MDIQNRLKSFLYSVYLFLSSKRKGIATTIVLFLMGLSIYLEEIRGPLATLIISIGTLILASDYTIVKYISDRAYDWIEFPDQSSFSGGTLESSLEMMEINYYSKLFEQNSDTRMDVIQTSGRTFGVDSRNNYQYLTKGMVFKLKYVDKISFRNEQMEVNRHMGFARVQMVGTNMSRFKIVEWTDPDELEWNKRRYKKMKRKIMVGDPEKFEVFVEFEASAEVKNSELDELEKAYNSVHTIYKNRGALS